MANVNLVNLARMTVSSTGTGTITLANAVTGFLTFDLAGCSTAAAGSILRYAINDTTASEIGYGTYTSSALTLTRGSSTTGMKSTNSNSAINMSNSAQVFVTPAAADFPFVLDSGGTGASCALALTLSAALTYGGVTLSNAVTGTGNMVLSASPTLSGTIGGALTFSGAHTLSSALTYGGVTLSNAVTGTGNMVLSASPTFTGTLTAAAVSTSGQFTISDGTGSPIGILYGSNATLATTNGLVQIQAARAAGTAFKLLGLRTGASGASGSGTEQFSVNGNGDTLISSSTASATTSTGALVVMGGVGVGGAITLGGNIASLGAGATCTMNAASGNPSFLLAEASVPKNWILHNTGVVYFTTDGTFATKGVQMADNATSWSSISDARLPYKRTARDITDKLPSLQDYRLYENEIDGRLQLFSKAQEVAKLFPHVVTCGDDDPDYVPESMMDPRMWSMSYDRLGAVALAYARQHDARLARLEAQCA